MLFSSEKIEKCVNRYLHNIPEGEGGWKEILVLDPVATQQLCNPGHLGKLLQGVLKLAKHHGRYWYKAGAHSGNGTYS